MPLSAKVKNRLKKHHKILKQISGTSTRPRLVVYRSLKHIYASLVDDKNHKILIATSDIKLKNSKKTKMEKAKEVGLNIAKAAQEKNITVCMFDRAGYKYHGRVKNVADGAREGKLQF